MSAEGLLFPASVVGSMPRPDFVRDLIAGPDLESLEERMDAAVRYVVALQEQAGLDVVTDGEWRRKSYIGVIAELAHGFELSTNPADGRPWTLVVDKLAPKEAGFVAKEISFLRSITQRQIKATLPSPALLGERMWEKEISSRAYPDQRDFVRDCVPILRCELLMLLEAGADIVQIDDPHLCLFVDPEVRASYEDPVAAADFAVDVVNELVAGIEGVKLALHLCRRAGARVRGEARFQGGFEPILAQINRLQVDHVTMEFSNSAIGDFEVLDKLRPELEVGFGCVGVTPGKIDTVEEITARVHQALRHLAPERITLNPDCGFAPGSGARASIDEVYQKLKNEAEAARILRGEFA